MGLFFFICPPIAKAISVVAPKPYQSNRLKDTLERDVYLYCSFKQITSSTRGFV